MMRSGVQDITYHSPGPSQSFKFGLADFVEASPVSVKQLKSSYSRLFEIANHVVRGTKAPNNGFNGTRETSPNRSGIAIEPFSLLLALRPERPDAAPFDSHLLGPPRSRPLLHFLNPDLSSPRRQAASHIPAECGDSNPASAPSTPPSASRTRALPAGPGGAPLDGHVDAALHHAVEGDLHVPHLSMYGPKKLWKCYRSIDS